jgi:hypothetical protein
MDAHPPRPQPREKSKTALRRGHFTPGHHVIAKPNAPRFGCATTLAEQAMLFAEAAAREPADLNRTTD